MIGAILKGTFRGVLNLFQDGLVTVVEGLAKMLNKVLPDKYEINIGNLEQFKSSGKSIGEEITAAIAQTSPSTFKKDFGGFWDEAVKKQEAVVDKLDKIELKPAADNLRKAGKAIEEGAQVGAASLVDAGVKVAEEIKEAARMMSSVSYTGRNYADQSDASLEGVAARLRAQLSSSYGPSKPQLADANFQSDYGAWMMAQMLKDQLAKVEGELEGRRNIRGVIARSGEDAAREKYGDTSTDKALRDMADTSTRSTNALENIERGLRTSKLIR